MALQFSRMNANGSLVNSQSLSACFQEDLKVEKSYLSRNVFRLQSQSQGTVFCSQNKAETLYSTGTWFFEILMPETSTEEHKLLTK